MAKRQRARFTDRGQPSTNLNPDGSRQYTDAGKPVKWDRSKPFPKGQTLTLTHGAFHAASLEPVARAVVEAAHRAVPYLAEDQYQPAVTSWATTEARSFRVRAWLAEHGDLDGRGKVRPAAEFLLRNEKLAGDLRARLGLDPLSRARLGRELAGLEAEMARHDAESALDAYRVAPSDPSDGPDGSMGASPDNASGDES